MDLAEGGLRARAVRPHESQQSAASWALSLPIVGGVLCCASLWAVASPRSQHSAVQIYTRCCSAMATAGMLACHWCQHWQDSLPTAGSVQYQYDDVRAQHAQ